METEITRYNAEDLPPEWDVPSNKIQIRNHSVTWSYQIQDKSNLTGFKVWFMNWETEGCKLVLLNNTYDNLVNVQWKGLSFLNVSGNSIKVVFGLQHISSMNFSLYRKNGKLVYSQRVQGLDDIDSDMSLNHCPCYVESLGKKVCLKCERKNSNEFHVPGERSSM
ncbi:unnamed protein product [Mytilus edulis]|uniref:Uncharacterized protein n=1 Tax=Mytilus edulis TaxID=6550 RepID=A0A8S3PXH8_MYTED|nr:unnamed protein product [Mytilus edulis]